MKTVREFDAYIAGSIALHKFLRMLTLTYMTDDLSQATRFETADMARNIAKVCIRDGNISNEDGAFDTVIPIHIREEIEFPAQESGDNES